MLKIFFSTNLTNAYKSRILIMLLIILHVLHISTLLPYGFGHAVEETRGFNIELGYFNMTTPPVKTLFSPTIVSCWSVCRQTLGCVQVEFNTKDHTCSILTEIPEEINSASSDVVVHAFHNLQSPKHQAHLAVIPIRVHTAVNTADYEVHKQAFFKKRADTGVRISYFGDGGYDIQAGQASRWLFKFNGQVCASPCLIDLTVYNGHAGKYFWPQSFEGICRNIPNGMVDVSLHLAKTATYTQAKVYVARTFPAYFLIEEVEVPRITPMYPSTVQLTQGTICGSNLGYNMNPVLVYQTEKLHNDSLLFVHFSFNMRLIGSNSCRRWIITFNGNECSNPGRLEAVYYVHTSLSLYDGAGIGGMCRDIPSGHVTVEVSLSLCRGGPFNTGQARSHWGQNEYLTVEEIYLSRTLADIHAANFNFHYSYWQGEDLTSSGFIAAAATDYNKVLSASVLRIRYFGSLGCYGSAAGTYEATWCFLVDGQNCTDPAPMCFNHYTSLAYVLKQQRPFQLVGVCRNLPRKKYSLSLHVQASGLNPTGTVIATGMPMNASNFLIIDEIVV